MLHQRQGMMSVPPRMRLYLLGAFRFERAEQPVYLSTRKIQSLLGFLALHPEPHAREKLAALFWGDFPDGQARRSLRTALAALRKELGDVLLADRASVQLASDPPLWVDVLEFEHAVAEEPTAAINLYQGDLLQDFYDDWLMQERERFCRLYLDTLLRLTQEARAASQYPRAIEYALKVLATDRANEQAYQHLIFCLAASGDRSAALKQFEECERALLEELGVAPSGDTIGLAKQIKAQLSGGPSRAAWLSNLPHPLTSFVGRRRETVEIKGCIERQRLVTLSGPGGSGKTRLAIEVASELVGSFKQGIWWAELASLSDPALVPGRVAEALGIYEQAGHRIEQDLIAYLRPRQLLLVLDNCEHLVGACASLVDTLLRACDEIKVLTTSREGLGIPGELIWRVPPLALPDPSRVLSPDALAEFDAVRLFAERAAHINPAWKAQEHAQAVVQICRRLDGMPLAIELAAARTRVLSVEQIATRLDDRFRILTAGSRTALPRHQTLRAAIDWSYDLLPRREQILLNRLSVFAGGWTLDAVEHVCAGQDIPENDVLDLLAHLVDKSLVMPQEESSGRYWMLETVRQYARDRLVESGEAAAVRDAHLDYFLHFAAEGEKGIKSAERPAWSRRVDAEQDNIRAALDCSLEIGSEKGLKLASAMERFWVTQHSFSEGCRWMDLLLAHAAGASLLVQARALDAAGMLASWNGDFETGAARLKASQTRFETIGDKVGLAHVLLSLGVMSSWKNDPAAISYLYQSIALYRETEERWDLGICLGFAAYDLRAHGEYATAARLAEESRALFQQTGDYWSEALPLSVLGLIAYSQDDYAQAHTLCARSLTLFREANDTNGVMIVAGELGDISRAMGDPAQAKSYYDEVRALIPPDSKRKLAESDLNLGFVALQQGHLARARSLFASGLSAWLKFDDKLRIAHTLIGLAGAALGDGEPFQAVRFLGASTLMRESMGHRLQPADRLIYRSLIQTAHEQLGQQTFENAWNEGQQAREQVLPLSLTSSPS